MLKYECKKTFIRKKTLAIIILLIITMRTMINTLSGMAGQGYEIALDNFVMTNNGWNTFFLCFVMAFAASSFYCEEKNNMSPLLMTSKKGKNIVPIMKMIPVMLYTELLVLLYIIANIIAYKNVFGEFGIDFPNTNELVAGCMRNNPNIDTCGEVFFIMMISFALYANFVAVLSMYLSTKKLKPINIYIGMLILIFSGLFLSETPIVEVFFALLLARPFSIEQSYIILCSIGGISVTWKYISFIVYIISIFILAYKVSRVYHKKN